MNCPDAGFAATPPAAVKSLAAWYDASDSSTITATTQNVSKWADKSSNGETLTQSTTSLQPTYAAAGMNGLGAITFSGAQQLISSDTSFSRFLYPTSTVFIVQNSASDAQASSSLWSGASNTQRFNFSLPGDGSCVYAGAPTGNNAECVWLDFGDTASFASRVAEPVTTYSTLGIHLWMGSGQSGTSVILRRDGSTIGSQTPDTATAFSCALTVGSRGGCVANSSFFNGSIGEIVVYDTLLSAANYELVEGILACKWGFQSQLASGHPYATTCPSGTESASLNGISGLSAWYDASDASTVTYNVSYVSQMNDKSGNGLTITQSTAASQPTLATVNGAQAVVFSGSQRLTSSTSNSLVTGSSPSSMFVVSAYTGSVTASAYGENLMYGLDTGSKQSRGVGKVYTGATAIATETSADVDATGSWSASSPTLVFASFGAATESIALNGGSLAAGAHVPNTAASTALNLGGDGGQAPWIGPVYEALVYNAALSTVEQQFIEGYLACKWGLQTSLPSTHPYKSVCPATASASLALALAVSPTSGQIPGTDLTYTTTFTNSSGTLVYAPVLSSPVPSNTWFKVGSATESLGSTGLAATVTYSNNNGSSYGYTPVSGGGGALSGYDSNVTNVRWTLSGALGPAASIDSGSVAFTARII